MVRERCSFGGSGVINDSGIKSGEVGYGFGYATAARLQALHRAQEEAEPGFRIDLFEVDDHERAH